MIRKFLCVITLFLAAFTGCTTPPEVKQALVDMDQGYNENLQMMKQYRQLVNNIYERHYFWYQYSRQRLLLNLSLRTMTRDDWAKNKAAVDAIDVFFNQPMLNIVNELRLAGLKPLRNSEGTIKIKAGQPGNTAGKIVERLPEIVNLVTEKAHEDYKNIVKLDMRHFDSYRINVQALKQINATIKRYLDIDVTITPEDISEISSAIRQLQQ